MTLTEVGTPIAPSVTGAGTRITERDLQPRRLFWLRWHPAWIVVVGACAVLVRIAMHTGLNTDVFWHLASGQWMLQHHAVIRHDPFSYTVNGHSWFAEEWGFEVILAWTVAHVGSASYWLFAAAPCCAAVVLSVMRWRRQGAQPIWSAVLAIVASLGLAMGVAPRPQVLSYALFALELLILTLARKDSRWLMSLPVIILVWANLHGSFLAGLGVLALDVALSTSLAASLFSPSAARRLMVSRPLPSKAAMTALGASVLAACVNPHGVALYTYALKVATSSKLAGYIDEWKSPDFHAPVIMAAVALPTVAAVFLLASGRRRVELFDLAVWLVVLVATLRATRFIPYLGIAVGGLLAPYQAIRRESVRPSAATPLLAAILCLSLLGGSHISAGATETKGSLANPVEATAWLAQQDGRVFSTYVWNDYLVSKAVPVFVDGRTDMYFGTEILGDYVRIQSLTIDPDPILSRYDIQWVLWPKNQPLSLYLSRDSNWALVRTFGSQLVFERSTPN